MPSEKHILALNDKNIRTDDVVKLQSLLNDINIAGINLANNHIGDDGLIQLITLLQLSPHINYLNISNNNINSRGLSALVDYLSLGTIRTLNLSHNNFDYTSLILFFKFLGTDTTLKSLTLDANLLGMSAASIKALSKSLQTNHTLYKLSLKHNYLLNSHMEILAESLKDNVGLKKISLSNNGFSSVGVRYLAKCLKFNKSLSEMSLQKIQICYSTLEELNDSLKYNATMTRMYFSKDYLDGRAYNILFDIDKKLDSNLENLEHYFKMISVGDLNANKFRLKSNIPINASTARGNTVLHIAARFHQLHVIDFLLDHPDFEIRENHAGELPNCNFQRIKFNFGKGLCFFNGKKVLHKQEKLNTKSFPEDIDIVCHL